MRISRTVWGLLVVMSALTGGALLLYAYLPFDGVQAALDRLAPDGRLESFTFERYLGSLVWLRWAGWLLLMGAAALLGAPRRTQRWISVEMDVLKDAARRWGADASSLWRDARSAAAREKGHLLLLGGIVAAAVFDGAWFLSRPMLYDEAYTYNIFASRPLLRIISDYHLPNNHIFHSILVHVSTAVFGAAPWAVRLPAFGGWLLSLVAAYLAARILFDADTAVLAAGLLGFTPVLMHYAANARGYSLLNLFFLILLSMAAWVRRQSNSFAWSVAAGAAVLGLYTLPTMLLPFGAVVLWLAGGWLLGETAPPRRVSWLLQVAALAVFAVGAAGVLYLPVVLGSGLDALLHNPFVAAIDRQDYWIVLQKRLVRTADVFTAGVSPALMWGLIAAFVVGVGYDAARRGNRPSFPLVVILFSAGVVLLRGIAPFDRMWLFLLPVFLIWAAAGLVWVYHRLEIVLSRKLTLPGLLFLVGVAFCLAQGASEALPRFSEHAAYAQPVAAFLGEHLLPGDRVVTIFPDDAPVIYYARLMGLDDGELFAAPDEETRQIVILVDARRGETPESVLTKKGIIPPGHQPAPFALLGEVPPLSIYRMEWHP